MKFFQKLIQRATLNTLDEMANDEKHRFMRDNPLLKDLGEEAYLFLLKRVAKRSYVRDELVFKQDNLGVCCFFVRQGSVEIYFESEEKNKTVYTIKKAGALFGEISAIHKTYRAASAKALENDTELFVLSSFDLEDLQKQYPSDYLKILQGITHTILDVLDETSRKLRLAEKANEDLTKRLG